MYDVKKIISAMQGQPKIVNPIVVRYLTPLVKHWCFKGGRVTKFYTGGNARVREAMAFIENGG